jgi:cytosine/adenosine deaminase-related metal-dependent hydrolase
MRAYLLLSTLLFACKDKDGTGSDTAGDGGADGGSSDGGSGDGGEASDGRAWTEGPALPECTAATGSGDLVALSGVVLLPDGPEAGLVVYSRSTGKITCAGGSCDSSGADVVCTEGVISAGLINPHDHLQYNVLAPWQHDGLYADRYEWRADDAYWDYREAYDNIEDELECEIMKWAELRHLVGGTTAAVGSSGDSCINVLVRNLDEDDSASGISGYELYYSSSTVTDSFDENDGEDYSDDLASGSTDAIACHVAEAVGGVGREEIEHMFDIGMAGDGEAFVHATDATTEQLARMRAEGTAIIWSPRSNLDLYAGTTLADVAARLNVPVAIGTDWSWSGSENLPTELSCAWDYLGARGSELGDSDVYAMATSSAAQVLGLDGVLGSLDVGFEADIAVYTYSSQPYRAVIEAGPEDVRLVVLDGHGLYGVADMVATVAENPDWCESVTACSAERSLCVQAAISGDDGQTYDDLESILSAGLAETSMSSDLAYAGELFPLWVCEDTRPSCDPRVTASGDTDGDGVADASDLCVDAWDPTQDDHDGDGEGDACDPCPLDAANGDCPHDADDVDGDGILNDVDGCPWANDAAGGVDSDGDGTNDACDSCPDVANAGNGPCPSSVRSLRDPSAADHPAEGSQVSLSGLVVTAIADGKGYAAQDPDEVDYGGIYVYDLGDASVEIGDLVDVDGTYVEYYGLTELEDATTTITGSTTPLEPIEISDACSIGTDGSLAEAYESMLVRVGATSVTDSNPDGSEDYNEFEVDSCLRVDDLYCSTCWADQPASGTAYGSLTGVLVYSYSDFKLAPRSTADIESAR